MKLIKKFTLRSIVNENVLIPIGETAKEFNGMITLTDTAVTLWENLEKVDSAEELINIMLDEYEVDRETATRDVYGFLEMLRVKGIME